MKFYGVAGDQQKPFDTGIFLNGVELSATDRGVRTFRLNFCKCEASLELRLQESPFAGFCFDGFELADWLFAFRFDA